jgi:hypothetical protein
MQNIRFEMRSKVAAFDEEASEKKKDSLLLLSCM